MTSRRTSGSFILHLWYIHSFSSQIFTSFIILLFLGIKPASLYFHILYFMYMFTSIYRSVASIIPRSLPNRKSFLFTILVPHTALCTVCIQSCTCLHSQKIWALFSSFTLWEIFPNSVSFNSRPSALSCSIRRWVLHSVHFRSTSPKCDITV